MTSAGSPAANTGTSTGPPAGSIGTSTALPATTTKISTDSPAVTTGTSAALLGATAKTNFGSPAASTGASAGSPAATAPTGRASAWMPVAFAAAGSFLLHALAVLWVWQSWRGFGRVGVLAWIDFPASLTYLRPRGGARLVLSLLLGGLQWGLFGAGLSLLFGRSARRPAR